MSDSLLQSTVSRLEHHTSVARSPRARCTIVWPRELSVAVELDDRPIVLGRAGDVSLAHKTVSRAHAKLQWDPARGAHALEDLGSHNGTSVNRRRISSPIALASADVLRLGDVLAVYERVDHPTVSSTNVDEVFGRAAVLDGLRASIESASRDLAPTLILGETGTGKERVAQAIHRLSARPGRLVAVNCAALSPQLFESQLFGHVKGAFTGAGEAREGLFRAADHGTLLLDEIGDLALELQPKLLRSIEARESLAVGATRPVSVSVKVVAATHRDLRAAVSAGTFRADLYGRLSGRELRVPSLRERAVDVLDWLDRFARGARVELRADDAEALVCARWSLNLRAVDRLARELCERREGETSARSLPAWLEDEIDPQNQMEPDSSDPAARPAPDRAAFLAAYEAHGGSVRALAKHFGRDRRQIYRWVDAYGLRASR